MALSDRQREQCTTSRWDFSDLTALFLNCTLKPSPGESHTDGLMSISRDILEANGVTVETIRPVDHEIPPGVYGDMTEHGFDRDDWPEIYQKVLAAEILVIGTPIWLGAPSSVCRLAIERLYANSGELNDEGQWIYYGRVGGCIVTGNEDGVKHASMTVLYALQHIGYTIPPQADCGWIGEVGPGASYGDDGIGLDNDFTRRNTTFMTWNLLHTARMLKDNSGFPHYGNDIRAWQTGERFGHPEVHSDTA